jgi:hypothetical protein
MLIRINRSCNFYQLSFLGFSLCLNLLALHYLPLTLLSVNLSIVITIVTTTLFSNWLTLKGILKLVLTYIFSTRDEGCFFSISVLQKDKIIFTRLKGILKLILVIFCISWKLAIGSINDIYETSTRFLAMKLCKCDIIRWWTNLTFVRSLKLD